MWSERNTTASALALFGLAAMIALGGAAAGTDLPRRAGATPAGAPVAQPVAPAPPVVRETGINLQEAFNNEMNANQRYVAFAKQADREGYPAVARLLRACATAEKVHADRHVQAIAYAGGQAKAVLEKLDIGTTAENLQTAIDAEAYEVEYFYPAMRERARADHQSAAVRSLTFALAAERGHLRLLKEALARLDERPAAQAFYVCPYCGNTVTSLDFSKCPCCFTGAGKFMKVS
jgi:rubrerythrin